MPEYIKDTECSRDTPVIWGKLSDRSYGTGKRIKPNIDGKHATDYEKKIYLPELLPLEEYVGDAESCVCHAAVEAIRQIISGKFTVDEITTPSELWDFPAGAFKGSDGDPC